jgi:hypothetical protein
VAKIIKASIAGNGCFAGVTAYMLKSPIMYEALMNVVYHAGKISIMIIHLNRKLAGDKKVQHHSGRPAAILIMPKHLSARHMGKPLKEYVPEVLSKYIVYYQRRKYWLRSYTKFNLYDIIIWETPTR